MGSGLPLNKEPSIVLSTASAFKLFIPISFDVAQRISSLRNVQSIEENRELEKRSASKGAPVVGNK